MSTDRDKEIIAFKSRLPLIFSSPTDVAIEAFQNECIRPILKFQHDLIISYFKHHFESHLVRLKELSSIQKRSFIRVLIQKNPIFKQFMVGVVVAFFSAEELHFYLVNTKDVNKRIHQMVTQRIADTLC